VWAHISLADLLRLDGDSALQEEWTAQVRARWAARRAAASETGSDGVWLDGDAAEGIACDAAMAPIVTGDVNVDALGDLGRLCVDLDARQRDGARDAAWAALEQAVIGKAVDLLSGPGGLASFLRRRQLGARLGGPSLPLDIGYAETIPAGIRNAVMLRDKHCQWAGRCDQPAEACQVHHTRHKADGGPTSVKDCVLLCWFHHQIAIHRWGWTLVLNPDGTTTAWNKDKTRTRPKCSTATALRSGGGDPRLSGDEFVVQGAVAHHAVGGRHQDGLKDPVPAAQGTGREAGLLAVEQGSAGTDGGAGWLAAQRRGGRLDGGVAPQAPGLPGLVVGAEEGPPAVEGDAHRGRDGCSVPLVGGQQDCLRIADRSKGRVGKGRVHAL
jgi:hypothetical protein